MTIDQLISNYELAKTNAARSGSVQKTCFDLVGYYAKRVRSARGGMGLLPWAETPRPLAPDTVSIG